MPEHPIEAADLDEDALDAASAHRIMSALRREEAARDGRQLARAWGHLADRVERNYPRGGTA